MTTTTSTLKRLTPEEQDRRSDLLVVGLCVIALVAGWFVKNSFQYRTQGHEVPLAPGAAEKVTLDLPTAWVAAGELTSGATLFEFVDPGAGSAFKTTMSAVARDLDPASPVTLEDVVDRQIAEHGGDRAMPGYQLLGNVADATVDGQPAKRIDYAYAAKPIDVQLRNAPPVVVHAIDYVVVKNNRLYILTQTIDDRLYADEATTLASIAASVKLP